MECPAEKPALKPPKPSLDAMISKVASELSAKKGKVVMKRPAGHEDTEVEGKVAMKRPAGLETVTYDPHKMAPVRYRCGVVYTCAKKNCYRVYKVRGDRLDWKISWGKDGSNKVKAWERAIALIDDADCKRAES